ncbi:MAG: dihydropteroate synthase, partial [Candidatus Fermentibacteria bacterium]|nr:dihydropteroate synthase [Candidatus Fermentibacteria bacterium]
LVKSPALPEFVEVNRKKLLYQVTPLVMGILNITPDSFSDGGSYPSPEAAANRAVAMEKAGAQIIDIGGESTRPGSSAVSAREQRSRVLPVIEAIRRRTEVPVSIDTCIPEVAEAAVKAGAGMINSINAMETPGMIELAASLGLPVVLMHMKGTPDTMQNGPFYGDASHEVAHYLFYRVEALVKAGLPREKILVDPGIGFGKREEDNIALIHALEWIGIHTGCRVLLGHSRKSFFKGITGIDQADQRDSVSHIVTVMAEGADVVRVHDVPGTVAALKLSDLLRRTL